ncbi:OmpA family protein [Thermodesulfovibrio sp. TK110]
MFFSVLFLATTMLLPAQSEQKDVVYMVYPGFQQYYYTEKAYFESKAFLTDGNEEEEYFAKKQRPVNVFTKEEILSMLKPETEKRHQEIKKEISITTVFFDFDSFVLRAKEKQKLLSLIPQIKQSNVVEIKINGYTDKIGTKQYNDSLALKRANTVKEFLIKNGVLSEKITVSGQGKCCYISDIDADNRRVEVIVR